MTSKQVSMTKFLKSGVAATAVPPQPPASVAQSSTTNVPQSVQDNPAPPPPAKPAAKRRRQDTPTVCTPTPAPAAAAAAVAATAAVNFPTLPDKATITKQLGEHHLSMYGSNGCREASDPSSALNYIYPHTLYEYHKDCKKREDHIVAFLAVTVQPLPLMRCFEAFKEVFRKDGYMVISPQGIQVQHWDEDRHFLGKLELNGKNFEKFEYNITEPAYAMHIHFDRIVPIMKNATTDKFVSIYLLASDPFNLRFFHDSVMQVGSEDTLRIQYTDSDDCEPDTIHGYYVPDYTTSLRITAQSSNLYSLVRTLNKYNASDVLLQARHGDQSLHLSVDSGYTKAVRSLHLQHIVPSSSSRKRTRDDAKAEAEAEEEDEECAEVKLPIKVLLNVLKSHQLDQTVELRIQHRQNLVIIYNVGKRDAQMGKLTFVLRDSDAATSDEHDDEEEEDSEDEEEGGRP